MLAAAMVKKILVVEDEPIVAMDIEASLQNLGYSVASVVATGEKAICATEETSPDLVLMDIRLRGSLDGIEAAAQISTRFDVPVVFLTAQLDKSTIERAKASGSFAYILKPFEEGTLQSTIEMAIAKHGVELRLKESERSTRLIIENALDAVITMDESGKITGWNPQAVKTFGWTAQEAVGRSLAETIVPLTYREAHRKGLENFLVTGDGPLVNKRIEEFTALHKDGHEFPVQLSISAARRESSYSFSAFISDITERKLAQERLERSERKYRTLVETTETGYLIIDSEGIVVDANSEYVRLSGHLTLADIAGRSVSQWTAQHDRERCAREIRRCVQQGYVRNLELDYVDQDGRITPVEINATVIESDQGRRLLCLSRDITERREANQALKQSNADLEEYAYVVSHDLKDPLGMIMRHVQFLERRYGDQLDARAREHIERIIQGTRNMERLIDELKANSEIGRAQVERVDCETALIDVRENLQSAMTECDAVLSAGALPFVNASRVEVVQLLQNLVGNAIKFRAEGRRPEIRISCRRDGGRWLFAVEDNGIGIAPEHRDRIFQIFERIGEKDVEGTGIGLANCRKAVERRGGQIWVESQVGVGSTFYFTLPEA